MTIEVSAKKVDDAINQGLKQLGASLDEVKVEVLESGGLFRKAKVRLTLESETETAPEKAAEPAKNAESGQKPAHVENRGNASGSEDTGITVSEKKPRAGKSTGKKLPDEKTQKTDPEPAEKKPAAQPVKEQSGVKPQKPRAEKKATRPQESEKAPDAAERESKPEAGAARKKSAEEKAAVERAAEFVKTTLEKMGFTDFNIVTDAADGKIDIDAPTGDDSLIIGRHGETLSALRYLAETGARAEKCHLSLSLDCNGYRERRAASLSAMARRRADECVTKHRKIKLENMDRVDRRTVHNALNDDDRVVTASEGKEPYRYVVIMPKDMAGQARRPR